MFRKQNPMSGGMANHLQNLVLNRRNTVLNFVPQQEIWVVERFGKFNRLAESGINVVIPFLENISYVHSLKEIALPVDPQPAVTQDNVQIRLSGNIYLRVIDPFKASYNIENPFYAVTQLAQTALRSVCGKMTLDETFEKRDQLNGEVTKAVNLAAEDWGVLVARYELMEIDPPATIVDAMTKQAQAERVRRAAILEADGIKEAMIRRAEGEKQAIVAKAEGEAKQTIAMADARAYAVTAMTSALQENPEESRLALNSRLASEYIDAYAHLAGHSNTIVISDEASDVTKMVSKALSIVSANGFSNPKQTPSLPALPGSQSLEVVDSNLSVSDPSQLWNPKTPKQEKLHSQFGDISLQQLSKNV